MKKNSIHSLLSGPQDLLGFEEEAPNQSGDVIDLSNGLGAIPVGTVVDYGGMICVKQPDGKLNCAYMPSGEQYARTKEGDHDTAIVIVPG